MMKYFVIALVQLLLLTCLSRTNGTVRPLKNNPWPHKTENRIIGGLPAGKNEIPHQALVLVETLKGTITCGGTILGVRHILTAEHCMNAERPTRRYYVLLGISDLREEIKDTSSINRFQVQKFIRYSQHKDIGILQLERDIAYSLRISPACIPPKEAETFVDRKVVVSGFGGVVSYLPGQKVRQKSSNALLKTRLQVISPDTPLCRRSGANGPDKICAYRKGHDSCQGDSGGPMTIVENGTTVVIGVVSSGLGCGASEYAGVYMRVSYFHDWIKKHVNDVCVSDQGKSKEPSEESEDDLICEIGDEGDKGASCSFPFIFNGKSYAGCTLDGVNDGIPWCSTHVDGEGVHIGGSGRWRHCQDRCLQGEGMESDPPSVQSSGCEVGHLGDSGARCVFPFIFNGRSYRGCTHDSSPDGIPWCSTWVNWRGVHVPRIGKWRHCQDRCLEKHQGDDLGPSVQSSGCEVGHLGDSGARCVFPFILNGRSYNGCTLDSSPDGVPWCSTRVDHTGVHVGGRGMWRHCENSLQCLDLQPNFHSMQEIIY